MAEYIDREMIRAALFFNNAITDEGNNLLSMFPAVPVVSREEFEQVETERNAARFQLKLIGKKIGDSMDDVRIIRKGKWLRTPTYWAYCSYCGEEPPSESNFTTRYCPNCGAEMENYDKLI